MPELRVITETRKCFELRQLVEGEKQRIRWNVDHAADEARACGEPAQLADKCLPPTMRPWVFHDLRRTTRKLMTRAGVRADVAEIALGHSIKGIQKIYDDITEYRPFVEHALECAANEVDKIINPPSPNVVPLKKRKRA